MTSRNRGSGDDLVLAAALFVVILGVIWFMLHLSGVV